MNVTRKRVTPCQSPHTYLQDAVSFPNVPCCGVARRVPETRSRRGERRSRHAKHRKTRSTLKMNMRGGSICAWAKREGHNVLKDRACETISRTRALTRFQRGDVTAARCRAEELQRRLKLIAEATGCRKFPVASGPTAMAGYTTGLLRLRPRCTIDGRSPGHLNRSEPESRSSRGPWGLRSFYS